jgi:hypothetical protein
VWGIANYIWTAVHSCFPRNCGGRIDTFRNAWGGDVVGCGMRCVFHRRRAETCLSGSDQPEVGYWYFLVNISTNFDILISSSIHLTMQGTNRVKSVLDKGGLALGVWQMLPGSNMSRTLARAGYDWVLVDCEHGNIDGKQCISSCI